VKRRLLSFLLLFTSSGTLICCALPGLLVLLGFGAAVAGVANSVPGLIWLSERKAYVFGMGAVLLAAGGVLQWRARRSACPPEPAPGEACRATRDWSLPLYWLSLGLYLIGAAFAYGPLLLAD
jgi:hypothetical protein